MDLPQPATISAEIREILLKPANKGFSQETIGEHYDREALEYDQMYLAMGYYDHIKCSELAYKHTPEEKRADCEVFDMGCGTGLVGEVMQPMGFNNITGCDASAGMNKLAMQKNNGRAYKATRELFLGQPDTFPEELRGKYNIITATGILAQGHLDSKVFDEMIMACKGPGSLILFTTRDMYLTDFGYQERMDELSAEGKWKLKEIVVFNRYDNLGDEVIGRWRKVEVKCFAYETL